LKNLTGTKIKNQQVLISKVELEKEKLTQEKKALQNEIALKEKQLKKYKDELESLKKNSNEVIVSEHAIIRYLQRIYKLDLEKLEDEILTDDIKEKIKMFGSGSYNSDDFGIKVVDNIVVTVFDKIDDNKQAHKKRLSKSDKEKIIDSEMDLMISEYQ
jgi:DNA gyrase/topoisomerase IV subunit A